MKEYMDDKLDKSNSSENYHSRSQERIKRVQEKYQQNYRSSSRNGPQSSRNSVIDPIYESQEEQYLNANDESNTNRKIEGIAENIRNLKEKSTSSNRVMREDYENQGPSSVMRPDLQGDSFQHDSGSSRQLRSAQERILELEGVNAELKARLDAREKKMQHLSNDNQELNSQISQKNAMIDKLEEMIEELKSKTKMLEFDRNTMRENLRQSEDLQRKKNNELSETEKALMSKEYKVVDALNHIDSICDLFKDTDEVISSTTQSVIETAQQLQEKQLKINEIVEGKYIQYLENCKSMEVITHDAFLRVNNKLQELKILLNEEELKRQQNMMRDMTSEQNKIINITVEMQQEQLKMKYKYDYMEKCIKDKDNYFQIYQNVQNNMQNGQAIMLIIVGWLLHISYLNTQFTNI